MAKGDVEIVELTRAQQVLARRVAESRATAPGFVLGLEADMDAALALGFGARDLVVRAAALALREFPRANGAYRDGRLELYSRVNVGIALAAHEALAVPTIFDADVKPVAQVAAEAAALEGRARAGELTSPELAGGTFTVLELPGVARVEPVLNPPQAAALGIGSPTTRAAVRDGEVVASTRLELTLACDHRILYGALAAAFLARIAGLLEEPAAL